MNFLLKKLINKFILLKTINGELFKGKVLGIFQDAIVIQGKKKSIELSSFSNPSTYSIAINHIIWFEENHETPTVETAEIDFVASTEVIEDSVDVIGNIEESVEILENLFGTIEGLIQDEVRNNLASGFDVKFELALEDKNK